MNYFLQTESINNLLDPFIVEALQLIENEMNKLTGLYIDDASILCAVMLTFYLFVQAYTLMTGDGKVDILPLVRPFIFFVIVANWGLFVSVLDVPLKVMDQEAKGALYDVRAGINQRYQERGDLQIRATEALYAATHPLEKSLDLEEGGDSNVFVEIYDATQEIIDSVADFDEKLAYAAMAVQTKITTAIQQFFEWIMLIIFKGCVYFLYYLRIILHTLLKTFGPFIFALSVIGAYRDLWMQWVSKFVSVGLYGAVAHVAIIMSFLIISLALDKDIAFLEQLIASYKPGGAASIATAEGKATVVAVALSGSASGYALVIAFATGIFGLLITPLVATWILGANSTTAASNKAINLAGQALKK